MKKIILCLSVGLFLMALQSDAFAADSSKITRRSRGKTAEADIVTSEAGLNIPDWGLSIDAFYDPRLTDLIPGYHIVNIVVTNRRNAPIQFNPSRDKWIIIDKEGRKHTAKNHVEQFNSKLWTRLPDILKSKLDYPQTVDPGHFTTIDVFVPKNADLLNFKEVSWKSHFLAKEFNVFTSYEGELSVAPDDKQQRLPETNRGQPYTDEDYLKTKDEVLNSSKWQKQKEAEERKKAEQAFDPADDAIILD